MPTEIEIEMRAPDKDIFNRLLLDENVSQYIKDEVTTRHIKTRYYDTVDFSLNRAGFRIRVREIDGMYIAALKTNNIDKNGPEGLSTVHSWQCIVQDPLHTVDKLISVGAPDNIADIIGGRELQECYQTEYRRTSAILHMPEGLRVELAMDEGSISIGGRSKPLMRLELELLFGDVSNLLSFAKMLREDYGLEYETRSRFERIKEISEEGQAASPVTEIP